MASMLPALCLVEDTDLDDLMEAIQVDGRAVEQARRLTMAAIDRHPEHFLTCFTMPANLSGSDVVIRLP